MHIMQVYLVGGAVRDRLLGRPVHERDWVVVGADARGARARRASSRWGANSRCSCIRETHEEYALARLERKVAPGYRGFTTQFARA